MKVKVCLIQDSPVFFNKEKTLQKVESLVKKYSSEGCELILFPESFVPGYPRGFSFGAKIGYRTDEGRKLYAKYHANSFDLEGEDLIRIKKLSTSTGTERTIWAEAGGNSLVTFDTKIGKLGGLICWENYMPLARMAMYQQGVEIYLAPTADSREEWTTTMK